MLNITPLRYQTVASTPGAQSAPLWTSARQYAGGFSDRRSRFDIRRLRRYGDFDCDVPLVVLWVDNGGDWDDIWAIPVAVW